MNKTWLGLGLFFVACHGDTVPWTPVSARDMKDDPAVVRPGYGNADTHTWWPLTETEKQAIKAIEPARKGDAHALLTLAIIASGDKRDDQTELQQRVDKFVADLKPVMDAADEWHKGYELNRAMHRDFFHSDSELKGYELGQHKLTTLFATGKFNCLSSALLYLVLARAYDLPVRGVITKTHAFVEMGPREKPREVETTTATGYAWVHDEKYFKDDEGWSKKRGLEPMTFDEYKARRVIEPHALVAQGLVDGRITDPETRGRLTEIAGLLAPEDPEIAKIVINTYIREAHDLDQKKAYHTVTKMFDTVAPSIGAIASKTSDSEILQDVDWMRYYAAHALVLTRRADDAIALVDEGLKALDPKWKDYIKVRDALVGVLSDQLLELMHEKDYPAAIKLISPRFEMCRTNKLCSENLVVIYHNQAVEHENRGDHSAALNALRECVQLMPEQTSCKDDLRDFERR